MNILPLDYATHTARLSTTSRLLIFGSVLTSVLMWLSRQRPNPASPPIATPAQRAAASNSLANLEDALLIFEADTGRLPTIREGVSVLRIPPNSGEFWDGPYASMPMIDPWGRPWIYQLLQRAGSPAFTISSAGADGKPGTADDIHPPVRYCATGLMREIDVRKIRREHVSHFALQSMAMCVRRCSLTCTDVELEVARRVIGYNVGRLNEMTLAFSRQQTPARTQ